MREKGRVRERYHDDDDLDDDDDDLDDDDDDFDGIHPEYQWRIYLLVNPLLVYPPGHHHVG